MKRTLILQLHVLLSIQACATFAAAAEEKNPRFWIDPHGYAILSTNLGDISDGKTSHPLTLSYNSGKDHSILLPPGWEIPMLESRLVRVNERASEAQLPDGSIMILDLAQDSETLSGPPGVEVSSQGSTVTLEKAGERYVFERGRLREYKLKSGEEFEWRFDDASKQGRLLMNGREVLLTTRQEQGANGTLELNYLGRGERCMLHYDVLPRGIGEGLKQMGYVGGPSLYRIDMRDGSTVKLFQKMEGPGQSLTLEGWPAANGPLEIVLGPKGFVERVNNTKYTVENRSNRPDDSRAGVPMIAISDAANGVQLLQKGFYYAAGGVKHTFDLQNSWQTYYVRTPLGQQVRKELLNGKEVYKAYYDKDGRKMVSFENGRKIEWHALLKQEEEELKAANQQPGANDPFVRKD